MGPLSELSRPRFACTVMSDEQMRTGSKLRPPVAHGVNPRVLLGLESHFGPATREWLYRIAPKIFETHKLYHDNNVGTQSAGVDCSLD